MLVIAFDQQALPPSSRILLGENTGLLDSEPAPDDTIPRAPGTTSPGAGCNHGKDTERGLGDAEIGVQQIPELMAVSGIDIVGPLPGDLQNVTRFSAGIPTNAKEPDVGKALIAFLRTPTSAAVFKAKGLEPD